MGTARENLYRLAFGWSKERSWFRAVQIFQDSQNLTKADHWRNYSLKDSVALLSFNDRKIDRDYFLHRLSVVMLAWSINYFAKYCFAPSVNPASVLHYTHLGCRCSCARGEIKFLCSRRSILQFLSTLHFLCSMGSICAVENT